MSDIIHPAKGWTVFDEFPELKAQYEAMAIDGPRDYRDEEQSRIKNDTPGHVKYEGRGPLGMH